MENILRKAYIAVRAGVMWTALWLLIKRRGRSVRSEATEAVRGEVIG